MLSARMQVLEWWYHWFVSAGVDPQRAIPYAQSMQENSMDISHLQELNNHILTELGVHEANDRLLILCRIRRYIEQVKNVTLQVSVMRADQILTEDFCTFYPRKRSDVALSSTKTKQANTIPKTSISKTFENLPMEVLENILVQIPLINWTTVMNVCSKLYRLLNRYHLFFCITTSEQWWNRIERLSVSPRTKLKGEKFYHYASMMTNLKLLNIRGRFAGNSCIIYVILVGSSSGTAKLISNFPNLTELIIREDEITDEIVHVKMLL